MPSLTDLLKAAQQRQQELQAIEDQKAEAAEKENQKELAIEKQEFEAQLKLYAGDILDHLDNAPHTVPLRHGCTVLRVNVFHRALALRMSSKPVHYEPTGTWKIHDELRREYRNVPRVDFSSKEECVSGRNLSDYLLLRILQISEEYDSVLVQTERMNAEKETPQEKMKAEKSAAEERLRLFSKALYVARELHDAKIQIQIESASADQWTWPKDFILDLYKISWCTEHTAATSTKKQNSIMTQDGHYRTFPYPNRSILYCYRSVMGLCVLSKHPRP